MMNRSETHYGSPILNQKQIQELSPVLNRNRYGELSPVIGKRNIPENEKCEFGNNIAHLSIKNNEQSPDIFLNEAVQIKYDVSPLTESTQNSNIEIVSSQNGCTTTISSTSCDSIYPLYYHQPPKRRKKYRKGSIAHQLRKAVDLQRNRTAIFHHERFLNKTEKDIFLIQKSQSIKDCFIQKLSTEYGCTLLECSEIHEITDLKDNLSVRIILGPNTDVNKSSCKIGTHIRLFPPYQEKIDLHKGDKKCYYNVSKVVFVSR